MLDGTELKAVSPPCLLLAHPDVRYEAAIARGFRRLGWDVYLARSGPEIRRLGRMLEADVVILFTELAEESGWLTCDKLTREQPLIRVILVGNDLSPRNLALADFVGAGALIDQSDGLAPLVEELYGVATAAAS